MNLPRVFQFPKYKTEDVKEFLSKGVIEVYLDRDMSEVLICNRCGEELQGGHGTYPMRIQHLPVFNNHCYLNIRRHKGYCKTCKKIRSEKVEIISDESPHKSTEYAWWVGRLCEIAPVSQVGEVMAESSATVWRLDFNRMKRMLSKYIIPKVRRICVDEVYVRRKKTRGETRDDLFFTVICDLDTGRVIWVSSSRRKEALDEFFLIIGKKACEEIEVVACDLHKGYALSVKENCPRATLVWDRFHIMQIFDEAVNETRKDLHEQASRGSDEKRLSRGKFRFMFTKKANRRSKEEQVHIDSLFKGNEQFLKLEIIKESMHEFYRAKTVEDAKTIFENIGDWIWQAQFKPLMRWHNELERGWDTLKNYFKYKVTSALSEGMNNVIKTIKRSGYGYRNMHYFKLKILQKCGYLNSRYISKAVLEPVVV